MMLNHHAIAFTRSLGMLVVLLPLACAGDDAMLTSGEGPGSDDASASTSTSGLTNTNTTTGTMGSGSADDTGTTASVPDVPSSKYCDVFMDDCPEGYKCMPWANDGGSSWNEWRCFEVVEDPAGVDEPCHMLEGPLSGFDDCEPGAMCWDVDAETLEGTCFPFCVGSEEAPTCADADRFCDISGDGTPYLCSPLCDPIGQDCPGGQACYSIDGWWICAPDGSGDMGVYGDSCEFLNACDAGLVCVDSGQVPAGLPCEGTAGCCTEVCDITDPLGDAQCTGAAEGQTCQPWYDMGTAPAGYENVGVCSLP